MHKQWRSIAILIQIYMVIFLTVKVYIQYFYY